MLFLADGAHMQQLLGHDAPVERPEKPSASTATGNLRQKNAPPNVRGDLTPGNIALVQMGCSHTIFAGFAVVATSVLSAFQMDTGPVHALKQRPGLLDRTTDAKAVAAAGAVTKLL